MKKGLLIILSGPSGVGKGTVREYIFSNSDLPFVYSVSMTTRKPRNGEVDGRDYYFVTPEEFQRNIDNDNFLEYASFVGNSYGTPKDKVEAMRNEGKHVFLEIEVMGATQVLNNHKGPGVISFFLMPPSIATLEKRIKGRKTESQEVIEARLEKGRREMQLAGMYDYVVINDRIESAGKQIIDIILNKIKEVEEENNIENS